LYASSGLIASEHNYVSSGINKLITLCSPNSCQPWCLAQVH